MNIPDDYEYFQDRLKDFNYYKKSLKKSMESSNKERLSKILSVKQFFSVPWLVCHEYMFE